MAAKEGVYVEVWVSRRVVAGVVGVLLGCVAGAGAQTAPAATTDPGATAPAVAAQAAPAPAAQGGTIHGTVIAGAVGKPGGIALPGVAITATNTLTGKKFSTVTDIDGKYAMKIPRNGRYVVRVELAGFAAATQEVLLTGVETQAAAQGIVIAEKPTDFGMDLASRAAAAEAKAAATTTSAALTRGLQGLSLTTGQTDVTDASATPGAGAEATPSLGGLSDSSAATSDSVAVSGQQGQTNGLAGFSEDEIRQRIQDAVAAGRASGMIPEGGDPTNAIVGMLGGMMSGGGPGGGGPGGGGGGRGGRGGGGFGGSGAFRNFNPSQPHGSIFYQGSNAALNASSWKATAPGFPHFEANPSGYSNRFGVSLAESPYIPGLTKPDTKQFVFLNVTGQRNLNPFYSSARVPTDLERAGNFSQSYQVVSGQPAAVIINDPRTGNPLAGDTVPTLINCTAAQTCIQPQAAALLKYYPEPNMVTPDPTAPNYQTISNAGNNNVAINSRYVRTIGGTTATPFGNFGGGGGGGGGRRAGANSNAPPALRQNINVGFNYSHSAQDNRNIFLPLGGANESNGYSLNVGYTIGYGRLSNNASVTWNRSLSETRNYFTDKNDNPTVDANICVPNGAAGSCGNTVKSGLTDPKFYYGVPSLSITNFAGLSNQTPSETIGQTISFSDFVAWRHKKHNMRYGLDVRRVHSDAIGGGNPLGTFAFTGLATGGATGQGSGFADFLLGLPQSTSIQAGTNKIYLRENVYDWYVTDDWRLLSNVTINYGLRYEYFAPYTEKYNRLANLDHNADFTAVAPVVAGGTGSITGEKYSNSLVDPDRTMFSPRFGIAWRPKMKWAKDLVVRGGYGINYNTGNFASFAKRMSFQPQFAVVQTNTVPVSSAQTSTGCVTATPGVLASITLANGFDCSTAVTIQNNYAVNKDYRLGYVQVYNLNIQRTIPLDMVFNIGYSGSYGSDQDIQPSPNSSAIGSTIPGVAPFKYEDSVAGLRSNQLVVSLQKRQQKGISLGVTYTYAHSIDDASSIGGGAAQGVQNYRALYLEEANSAFDQRHNLTGNWLIELPFGPNRALLNKGGFWAAVLDGFGLSGSFTIASGNYFTPAYSGNRAEESSGGYFTQRPDRVFSQPIPGAGKLLNFFNTAAFAAPAGQYGTASRDSIEGPGTVSTNAALSRTVKLGDTSSFEARVSASNVFNTVQYSNIDTNLNSATYGQVTGAAGMRSLQVQARYRF